MKRRIALAASTLGSVALLVAVAGPASAAAPPPGKGLFSFGTWTCDGLGEVELVGPRGDKAASGYTATGEHIISFSLDIHGTFEGETIDFSKTYGQRSALTPFTCIQHAEDAQAGTDITLTLVVGLAPPQ
jgi:hypothetical protein